MDKHAVRQTLDQLAAFLVVKGENAARVRAMQHAARSELLATGRSSALDELREQVPPGLAEMLRIPGLGAAKVRQIHESLAIESLAELEAAAGDGRLAGLPRFGAKTAENVRRGIAHLRQASTLRLFHHAQDELDAVRRALAGLAGAGVLRVESAGAFPDEPSVYRALGLAWVPPELREGTGELEAAAGDRLPHLVEQGELRGFLHCHSNYSDGTVTTAAWAAACRTAGYEWVGITDHSK